MPDLLRDSNDLDVSPQTRTPRDIVKQTDRNDCSRSIRNFNHAPRWDHWQQLQVVARKYDRDPAKLWERRVSSTAIAVVSFAAGRDEASQVLEDRVDMLEQHALLMDASSTTRRESERMSSPRCEFGPYLDNLTCLSDASASSTPRPRMRCKVRPFLYSEAAIPVVPQISVNRLSDSTMSLRIDNR